MSGPAFAFGATCCTVTIVTIILVVLGFSKLEVNEVGIDYSANSLTLNTDKLYSNGIYFIGVGHSFIKFPKRQLELTLQGRKSIVARSNDGLVVSLNVKLLYSLQTDIDALASLYLMFGDDYQVPIENICRSVVRDVASGYTAFQFWTERSNITRQMDKDLRKQLDDIFVKLQTFLLSSYRLPASFQKVIDETEVQRQEIKKVNFELLTVIQQTQAAIKKADEKVRQIDAVTGSSVKKIQLETTAETYKLNVSIKKEIAGYKAIKNALNMSISELTTLIWLEKMGSSDVGKTIAVRTPSLVKI